MGSKFSFEMTRALAALIWLIGVAAAALHLRQERRVRGERSRATAARRGTRALVVYGLWVLPGALVLGAALYADWIQKTRTTGSGALAVGLMGLCFLALSSLYRMHSGLTKYFSPEVSTRKPPEPRASNSSRWIRFALDLVSFVASVLGIYSFWRDLSKNLP